MWTDNETTADLLGFRVHADLIRGVVTDKSLLPVTVGVFGDWGGGKTSILKMLEQDLDPERHTDAATKAEYERVACLYINGWLFEGYDDAKAALLSAVLLALGEHKRFGPKIRQKAASLLKSVNWMRIARFGLKEVALPVVAAYVSGGATALPAAASVLARATGGLIGSGDPAAKDESSDATSSDDKNNKEDEEDKARHDTVDWEKLMKKDARSASPLDVRSFRDRFATMLRESDIDTLVVLIDDLDRCEPDRIIDNLEAIKLFLNVHGTAFVIGADPRIVRHAIARRYRTQGADVPVDQESDERLVTDYLEKLIQVPYGLPRLSPAETETYMALLFASANLNPVEFTSCLTACDAQRAENRYGVFGYAGVRAALGGGDLNPALTDTLLFAANAAPLITEGLKGNPRQVKRFLNALMLRKRLAATAKLTHMRDDVLVKLMILEYSQPKLFQDLFGWQVTQAGFPAEIQKMEESVQAEATDGRVVPSDLPWTTDFARRWTKMQPALADVDLRDYFWVARDRLASTLSGLSLIPPVVRRVLDDLLSGNAGKGKAAASAAVALEADHRDLLLDALSTHLIRQPDKKIGFDAVRALVEAGMLDAIQAVVDAAPRIATDRVPPAVGMDLKTLVNAHPAIQPKVQPILDKWAETATQVGRALKPRPGKSR